MIDADDAYWVGFLGATIANSLETDDIIEIHEQAAASLCAVLLENPRLSAKLRHEWIKAIVKEDMRNGTQARHSGLAAELGEAPAG